MREEDVRRILATLDLLLSVPFQGLDLGQVLEGMGDIDPVFFALDVKDTALEVKLLPPQGHQLGDPEPVLVEHLDYEGITVAVLAVLLSGDHQADNVRRLEEFHRSLLGVLLLPWGHILLFIHGLPKIVRFAGDACKAMTGFQSLAGAWIAVNSYFRQSVAASGVLTPVLAGMSGQLFKAISGIRVYGIPSTLTLSRSRPNSR